MLEIGAGIGFISTLLSRQRRVSRVLAVEANPHLLDYMARLHALQPRAEGPPGERGADQRAGDRATFYLRRDFWMGSLIAGAEPLRRHRRGADDEPRWTAAR